MYKKLFIIVILIISLIVISELIEFRILSDIDKAETTQLRSLRVLRDIEHIKTHMGGLEKIAFDFLIVTRRDANSSENFWRQYNHTMEDIDEEVAPLHNGDCKTCHRMFLKISSELKFLHTNLEKSDRFPKESSPNEISQAIDKNVAKLAYAANKVNILASKELANATKKSKQLSADIKTMKILERDSKEIDGRSLEKEKGRKIEKYEGLKKRVSRGRNLVRKTELIKQHVGELKEGINRSDPTKTQAALSNLFNLVKFEPIPPPLKGECYMCHYSLAKELPKKAKSVALMGNKLFLIDQNSTAYNGAVSALEESLVRFEKSGEKILDLARTHENKAMQSAREAREMLKLFMLVFGTMVILTFTLVSFFVVRWARRRLTSLSKAIEVVSEGNYSHVLDPGAKDEIGDVIHVFNIMIGQVRSSQDKLTSLNQELREIHLNTVKAFIETIEAKDAYTRGHSENVARYSLLLGQEIGLTVDELEEIHVAALLHDIGKIGIREDVLGKETLLTDSEYEHIKSHPIISAQIVGRIPNLAHKALIIRHHHERFNGKGYPEGLMGREIPLGARILAIADAFDAMTSNRPYREGCSKKEALEELGRCSGTQFDPDLVEAFIKAINSDGADDSGDALSIA